MRPARDDRVPDRRPGDRERDLKPLGALRRVADEAPWPGSTRSAGRFATAHLDDRQHDYSPDQPGAARPAPCPRLTFEDVARPRSAFSTSRPCASVIVLKPQGHWRRWPSLPPTDRGRDLLRGGAPGTRIAKLPQEFPRAHRRWRTWLEAPQHVLQPTDHAGREELLVCGRPVCSVPPGYRGVDPALTETPRLAGPPAPLARTSPSSSHGDGEFLPTSARIPSPGVRAFVVKAAAARRHRAKPRETEGGLT